MTLLEQGYWNRWPVGVPSSLSYFLILWKLNNQDDKMWNYQCEIPPSNGINILQRAQQTRNGPNMLPCAGSTMRKLSQAEYAQADGLSGTCARAGKLMVAIMFLLFHCTGLHVLINTLVPTSFCPENACCPTGLTKGTISSLLPWFSDMSTEERGLVTLVLRRIKPLAGLPKAD